MRMLFCAALVPAIVVPAAAQVDAEAVELVAAAAEKMEQLEGWSSAMEIRGSGLIGSSMPVIDGRLTLLRHEDAWYVRGVGTMTHEDDATPIDIAWTPEGAEWVDHENETVFTAPRARSKASMVRRYLDEWIFNPGAMQARTEPDKASLGEETELDGVAVRTVLLEIHGERERWHFGKSDNLPRRIESITPAGSIIYKFANIDTGVVLEPGDFAVNTPEGYERVAGVERKPNTDTTKRRLDIEKPQQGERAADAAPLFELETPAGETVALADLQGSVVLLDFWGTWCPPCRKSSPEIQKLHEDYAEKGVKVYGLAVRERSAEAPVEYMKENGYTYGLLLNADRVAREYKVRAYPTFIVIAADGSVAHVEPGYNKDTFPKIRAVIDTLIDPAGEGKLPDQG